MIMIQLYLQLTCKHPHWESPGKGEQAGEGGEGNSKRADPEGQGGSPMALVHKT